jgi:hypothetical protein
MANVKIKSQMKPRKSRGSAMGVGILLVALMGDAGLVWGQAANLPSTRPLLDQLNHETQALFKEVAPSIVRVEMPLPTNVSLPPDDPLAKWAGRLDQNSLRQLMELQSGSPGTPYATSDIRPVSVPASSQESPSRRRISSFCA